MTHTVVSELHQSVHRDFTWLYKAWSVERLQDGIAVIPTFTDSETFSILKTSVMQRPFGQRVHIPAHKRGVTIPYSTLRGRYPEVARFYQGHELANRISEIVGDRIFTTPLHDQSSGPVGVSIQINRCIRAAVLHGGGVLGV